MANKKPAEAGFSILRDKSMNENVRCYLVDASSVEPDRRLIHIVEYLESVKKHVGILFLSCSY